jgi:hypothetical protein
MLKAWPNLSMRHAMKMPVNFHSGLTYTHDACSYILLISTVVQTQLTKSV